MKKILSIIAVGLITTIQTTTSDAAKMVQIKGSDTLINVVQRLAEVYMEENPGKYIAVTGGGSGTGVAALINNKCDIANSSRLIKPAELKMASDNGVMAKRVVIAIDGLSIIVNPGLGIDKLTFDQVGAIFRGDITNWSEVGGPDAKIAMYGRQSNSGTYDFMQEVVLKGDFSSKVNQMNGTAQIVEAVKNDRAGVGYVGVGYVKSDSKGLTILHIAAKAGGEYYNPLSMEDVKGGKYPIARPLNQYINGSASGDVKKFIDFELSAAGQRIIEEEGFFAIPAEYDEVNGQAGL